MKVEIKPNKRYLILEKTTGETPDALRRIGRAKYGSGMIEYAGCPKFVYDYEDLKMDGYYDTGFNENSIEFRGKDPKEIKKTLDERKKLKEFFLQIVANSGKTEKEFLDDYRMELSHNKIVDTTDMNNYLKLYFAMRGNRITPDGEEGNIAVYGKSMYKLVDQEYKEDVKAKYSKMRHEVKMWLHKGLSKPEDKVDVLNTLIYINWLKPLTSVEDYVLTDMVEQKIESIDALERLNTAIKTVDKKEISMTKDIATWVQRGIIKRQKNEFFYEEMRLGETIREVYLTLLNEKEILNELYTKS